MNHGLGPYPTYLGLSTVWWNFICRFLVECFLIRAVALDRLEMANQGIPAHSKKHVL